MEPYDEHLKNLWTEGTRDIAVAFLKRAIGPTTSLAELHTALQFDGVKPYLSSIRLSDVLGPVGGDAARGYVAQSAAEGQPRVPRRRRSAEQMQQLRQAILDLLGESIESLNTTQICQSLEQRGHEVDTMRVNLLLKGLLTDKSVRDLGGKPKAWRLQKA